MINHTIEDIQGKRTDTGGYDPRNIFTLLTELYFCLKILFTKKVGLDLSVISLVPPTEKTGEIIVLDLWINMKLFSPTLSLLAVCPFIQWAAVRTHLSATRAPPQKWAGFEVTWKKQEYCTWTAENLGGCSFSADPYLYLTMFARFIWSICSYRPSYHCSLAGPRPDKAKSPLLPPEKR